MIHEWIGRMGRRIVTDGQIISTALPTHSGPWPLRLLDKTDQIVKMEG
jgi:hypothetical protein